MEWSGDRAVRRLADWVERGKSPQQVGARYKKALSMSYVEYDSDYQKLWDARADRLAALRKAKSTTVGV